MSLVSCSHHHEAFPLVNQTSSSRLVGSALKFPSITREREYTHLLVVSSSLGKATFIPGCRHARQNKASSPSFGSLCLWLNLFHFNNFSWCHCLATLSNSLQCCQWFGSVQFGLAMSSFTLTKFQTQSEPALLGPAWCSYRITSQLANGSIPY